MPPAAADRSLPLVLRGTPRERGHAHGEALRSRIRDLLEAWDGDVGQELGMSLKKYLPRFQTETDFLPAIRVHTPALLEEVDGIAEGANVDSNVCRCLQCMDEHWTHMDSVQAQARDKCSTLAVAPRMGRPGLIGQNMDLPRFLDGFQVLFKVQKPGGPNTLVPSYPGFLGLLGLNDRGVGLGVNAISQLVQARRGLPVAFAIRGALSRSDARSAAAWLGQVPHASGQNYLLGDPEGFLDVEICTAGVVRCAPANPAFLCHTNHPLAHRAIAPSYQGWDEDRARADENHALTFTRLETLQRKMSRGMPGVDRVKRALRAVAHPIDGPYPTFTFCSVVMELSHQPRMRIALGRPDVTRFRTHVLGGPHNEVP